MKNYEKIYNWTSIHAGVSPPGGDVVSLQPRLPEAAVKFKKVFDIMERCADRSAYDFQCRESLKRTYWSSLIAVL